MKILNSTNVDGQLTILTGSATTPSLSVVNDTNTGIFFPTSDTIAFTEGGVEVMRINSSSNIGIGTQTPSQKLEVSGNVSATAFISTIASGTAPFTVSSTTSVVNLNADLLDGQHGTYYLDYTNITGKPTISDARVNILSGAGLTGSGTFTLNQSNDPLLPGSGLFPNGNLYPNGEISITLSLDTSSIRITGFTSTNTSSWISTTDGGFSFKKDIAIANVTTSDYPEVHFNLSTYSVAQDAIISYVDAYAGGITLYSRFIPTNTVSFDYIILKG